MKRRLSWTILRLRACRPLCAALVAASCLAAASASAQLSELPANAFRGALDDRGLAHMIDVAETDTQKYRVYSVCLGLAITGLGGNRVETYLSEQDRGALWAMAQRMRDMALSYFRSSGAETNREGDAAVRKRVVRDAFDESSRFLRFTFDDPENPYKIFRAPAIEEHIRMCLEFDKAHNR